MYFAIINVVARLSGAMSDKKKGTSVPLGFVREGKGVLVPESAHQQARRAAEMLATVIGEGNQGAMARALHWSPSHLSHVLSYRQPLKVSEFLALCAHVGAEPAKLLGGGGEEERVPRPDVREGFAADLEVFVKAAVRAGYNEEILRQIMLLITQVRG
jgi:hypothetical protein